MLHNRNKFFLTFTFAKLLGLFLFFSTICQITSVTNVKLARCHYFFLTLFIFFLICNSLATVTRKTLEMWSSKQPVFRQREHVVVPMLLHR